MKRNESSISGSGTALRSRLLRAVYAALTILFPLHAVAQLDTVRVPSDTTTEGSLNDAVAAARSAGKLSTTVFLLEPYGRYVLTGAINVPAGEKLTIIAPEPGITQETAPPQILSSSNFPVRDSNVTFRIWGEIAMRNLWLLYGNTAREPVGARMQFMESPDSINDQRGTFENVIFDYSSIPWDASGAVDVTARHFRGIFRNCYFKNCTERHLRYYGRAVSFPYGARGYHIDSLQFENCTFANMGYVYEQEDGNYADNVWFNHCTFVNVIMFPLESGWWHKLAVTNSIFMNTWLFGKPALASWEPEGGTISIDSIANFGFPVPFTEQDRRILFTNSSHFLEEWVREWMYNNPGSIEARAEGRADWVPVPQPMLNQKTLRFFDSTANGQKLFPYMNRAQLYDSTNPGFKLPPTNEVALRTFLYMKWWCCSDTPWAYEPERSFNREWPMREDLRYTNRTLVSGGMGGFPVGDLFRWFPDRYAEWKGQKESEETRILTWMNTGTDPEGTNGVGSTSGTGLPGQFALYQNFPNPFNPTTKIRYSVPSSMGRDLVPTGGRDGQVSGVSNVKLAVYDILGREVAVLVDEQKAPGSYSVVFDGMGLASGVYFYRMRAGGFVETKKLILLQ